MRTRLGMALLALCLGLFVLPQERSHALPKFKLKGSWQLIKNKYRIKVYQMKVKGSPLIAIKGETVFHANIAKVAMLLADVPSKVKWVNRMMSAKYLQIHSPLHYISYTRFDFPWPASDRDFLLETKMLLFPKRKEIHRYQWSVTHAKDPKPRKVIRAVMHYSKYVLKSVDNGKKTSMVVIGYGDPKGSIPAFIINFIQRGWPLKSLRGMKKRLKRVKIKPMPEVVKAFGKK